MSKPILHLVGGPTASGKSAYALDLALKNKGVIINTDAMQVYAGMPLLTAQPETEALKQVPHLLYQVTDPSVKSSVGLWLDQATQAIHETAASGQTPILVGGTGLYFKALTEGLAEIPPVPDAIHEETVARYEALGSDAFRAELAAFDPLSAERIKPNDRQRLVRAYAVVKGTGHPLDHWQKNTKTKPIGDDFLVQYHLLMPERDVLYRRCDQRFLAMMDGGALDEVKALVARNLDPSLPAMKVLGVPELALYLLGDVSLKEAVAKAQQTTRNYAKRQVTWFKHQWR